MARIRSIHPGLFTDEAFVSLSMAARVLFIGILTEADDHGVFEWKPTQFKMRLMPVDAVDVGLLLEEMEAWNSVKRFSSDGKSYGLVRNFCRYQRPKKPKYQFFIPSELRTYAGLSEDGSLPVLHQSSTGTENPPQMEEGGGSRRREGVITEAKASAPSGAIDREISEASVYQFGKSLLGKSAGGQITKLRKMFKNDWSKIFCILLQAEQKGDAGAWVAAVLKGSEEVQPTPEEVCPPEIYENVL